MISNNDSEKKYAESYIGDLQQLKADIIQFFTSFTLFIKERAGHKKAKELIIPIFIAGAGSTVLPEFTDWSALVAVLTLAGIFGGFIGYYVQGFFYRLGIILSAGKMEWGMARNITLFSGLPAAVAALATYLLNVLVFGGSSTGLDAALTPFDYIGLLLYVVFFCMSLVFCYKAARNIAGTTKLRSMLFLVVIPAICTLLLLALGASLQG